MLAVWEQWQDWAAALPGTRWPHPGLTIWCPLLTGMGDSTLYISTHYISTYLPQNRISMSVLYRYLFGSHVGLLSATSGPLRSPLPGQVQWVTPQLAFLSFQAAGGDILHISPHRNLLMMRHTYFRSPFGSQASINKELKLRVQIYIDKFIDECW